MTVYRLYPLVAFLFEPCKLDGLFHVIYWKQSFCALALADPPIVFADTQYLDFVASFELQIALFSALEVVLGDQCSHDHRGLALTLAEGLASAPV